MKIRFNYRNIFPVNNWVLLLLLATLVISVPLLVIFGNVFSEGGEIWSHILKNLVPGYVINTFLLMLGVAVLTFIMGVSTSWIVTMYRFPGRWFFEWALILPIALPAYISGFTWAGILDYTSPVYVFMRNTFGLDTGQYLFFDILSLPGAIIIFSLALYPYVYLMTRAYFLRQSRLLFEVSASLGLTPGQSFRRVALPMARPAIVAGVSLALMEVLNDYGLVKYFGVDTFTTGIFNAWFAFGNLNAAMKLSVYLMFFVLALILIERYQRGKMRYTMGEGGRPFDVHQLNGLRLVFAVFIISLPFLAGFLLPFIMLVYWAILVIGDVLDPAFWMLLRNSFVLASLAAVNVVIFAVFIAFTVRTYPIRFVKMAARFSTLGYALPGAVVAIGILVAFLWLEARLGIITGSGFRIALLGTWFALIYAYLVRFMAIGYNSIESGNERVSVNLDQASRSLGVSKLKTLFIVNLPLIKSSVLVAALLVFIDVLKELPLTLILRPFNFDTLAIRAFEYASDERLAEAAPAAVIIVLTGFIPVYLLNKMMRSGRI
jgi:iron(III) transport system permease protein